MFTDTEGIILRQTKIVNGRRMIVLFSKKYGKISAGTGINEKGRGKAALAMRPFTFGRYELFKSRAGYNINSAESIRSYYSIGEDIDKYMYGSYALEFTDRLLPEDQTAPRMFELLIEYFDALSDRNGSYETLLLAFQVKTLHIMGVTPTLSSCVKCGGDLPAAGFDVSGGGIICEACINKMEQDTNVPLIFRINFGIVDILKFFIKSPLGSLEKIALEPDIQSSLGEILKKYCRYHLDIGELKSEKFLKRY